MARPRPWWRWFSQPELSTERVDEAHPIQPAHEPPKPAPASEQPAPGSEPPDVAVWALGPLRVQTADCVPVCWGGQRARTLFQYLLLHDRPVHREVLMELFWPGLPLSSARGNLNVCVYGVRRALGGGSPGFVTYRDGCYSLNRRRFWSIDRERFLQAADQTRQECASGRLDHALAAGWRAATEYGGPLFEDDPNADWCTPERERLRELLLRTLECLGEVCLQLADHENAILVLERALREDACRESAHRALMTCFALRGQRDQVVRQFHRCTSYLDRELDVTPSNETVDLFHRLVSG